MSENVLQRLNEVEDDRLLATQPLIDSPQTEGEFKQNVQTLIAAYNKETKHRGYGLTVRSFASGRAVIEADPMVQIYVILHLFRQTGYNHNLESLENALLGKAMPFDTSLMERFLQGAYGGDGHRWNWNNVLRQVERFLAKDNVLTEPMIAILRKVQDNHKSNQNADHRKIVIRIGEMLGEGDLTRIDPGETWADKALADLEPLPTEQQRAWGALFTYCLAADGSKPSAKWRKEGKALREAIEDEQFDTFVAGWFSVVTTPIVETIHHNMNGYEYNEHKNTGSDANISLLKGLAWLCADRLGSPHEKDITRALGKLVTGCIKKIPGTGPWAVRAASAGVWALVEMGTMDAVGQLGILKTKTSSRTVLNAIESGLEAAAKKAGVTKADLEDMGIPTYGFEIDGTRKEEFGDCSAVATLSATGEIGVEWLGANGKTVKSVPAEVKKSFATELKEFKADMDAAAKTLTAQKIRFDSFYLPERVWKLSDWRERFGEHPLVSNIASRLIWHFSEGEHKTQGLFNAQTGAFEDIHGKAIDWLQDTTEVRLWHPIGFTIDEVLAWRNRLQELQITQPFKQAYREVYLLTEAELRTATYSNRFAGHLLKQHQMNALAALRGWKNSLRLMVDDEYPPASKTFPEYGIRAEYWIEGAGDDYGVHTTDTGTYLYLSTDQVRFYQIDAPENYAHAGGGRYEQSTWRNRGASQEPLPLTEVPAILFSEVMRDVDMFVGVCSVGNDPSWRDGGAIGSFAEYWSDYSFGDLSATAQTRRTVLEKLLPRLKIAAKCELTDKFLVVHGEIRTYKIHLGSGNILMEPNDQYLCIVENRSATKQDNATQFLPYEGDQRLAIILSKAFLLVEDKKITDVTITRQLALAR